MSNNRNLSTLANVLDDGTSGQVLTSQGSGVVAFSDATAGITSYTALSDLLAVTGMTAGDQAYVSSTKNLYIFNGSGWYKIAHINTTPVIASGGISDGTNTDEDGTFVLTDGQNLVVTITASDADEGTSLTYGYNVASGSSMTGIATVSQSSNVFTVSPSTNSGSFTLDFTVTDSIAIGTRPATFSLSLRFSWSSPNYLYTILGLSSTHYGIGFHTQFAFSPDGDFMAIGANNIGGGNINNGYIRIYERVGNVWVLRSTYNANTTSNYRFASSLQFSGDNTQIICGAWGAFSNKGIMHILTRTATNWSTLSSVTSFFQQSTTTNSQFGRMFRVSRDNKYIATSHTYSGSRLAITRNDNTNLQWQSSNTDKTQEAYFNINQTTNALDFNAGSATVDCATYLAVGDKYYDSPGTNSGRCLIYKRTGTSWAQEASIEPESTGSYDNFGTAVAINKSGDLVAFTSNHNNSNATGESKIYVYTRSGTTWSLQQKISRPTSVITDAGSLIKWCQYMIMNDNGDTIIAGNNDTDQVVAFKRNNTTWSYEGELQPPSSHHLFGTGLAGDKDLKYAAVGDYGLNSYYGAVMFYVNE